MAQSTLKVNGNTIETPQAMEWGLQDISDGNAGRDNAGIMHKDRIAQ
ncbi:MAG: hypothetical protein PHE09_20170 [Oscillospiraceae bacterium]|nr:hypothetical protein [Oscillospiraceae bacterium]